MSWQPIEAWHGIEFVDVVLISRNTGKRGVMPAVFDGERWRALTLVGPLEFLNPTHFMPLPEPPEAP